MCVGHIYIVLKIGQGKKYWRGGLGFYKIKRMHFDKYQGLGNDFVMVDAAAETLSDFPHVARSVCDRRFGIGADGLVLLWREENGVKMRIFNPDGSEAEMCGNASRCVPLFARERGWFSGNTLTLQTLAGPIVTEITDDKNNWVCVDMGAPRLKRGQIPMVGNPEEQAVDIALQAAGQTWRGTAVSMGNPHFVIFVPDAEKTDIAFIGPQIETHASFPQKTNVEFVQKLDGQTLRMRVWERGAGITKACGTGSCAALAAAVLTGRTDRQAHVILDGGILHLQWRENGHLFMTGPAQKVFTGNFLEKL